MFYAQLKPTTKLLQTEGPINNNLAATIGL